MMLKIFTKNFYYKFRSFSFFINRLFEIHSKNTYIKRITVLVYIVLGKM